MSSPIFGSGIRRREDPRLLTGTALYTDDITLPLMVEAAMLRSPYAHARIRSIDTSAAAAASGVVAVFTGVDTEEALAPVPTAWLLPDSEMKVASYPAIAKDTVRYVGDIVAVVVAENRYQAYDALDLINVDYEPLEVVTDPEAAFQAGAPQLHEEIENNQAFHWQVEGGDVAEAFDSADVVIKRRIIQQRLIPNAMEPRSALAQYTDATGELTLWNTTQNPHIVRFLCSGVTGVPEDRLRVIAPEVRHQPLLNDPALDHDISAVEGFGDVATFYLPMEGLVFFDLLVKLRSSSLEGRLGIGYRLQRVVVDLDQVQGVIGLVAILGDHHRHDVADIAHRVLGDRRVARHFHLTVGEQPGGRHWRQRILGVGAGEDGDHAAGGCRRAGVDGADAGMSVRATEHRRFNHPRQLDVIGVKGGAREQPRILAPPDAGAEYGATHRCSSDMASAATRTERTMFW